MKRTVLILALGCIGFSTALAQENKIVTSPPTPAAAAYTPLTIGSPIPDAQVVMKGTQKEELSLEQAKTGKGLLVMFSCNTCPYVVKSQARTKEIMKYAREKGIGMVVLNSNTAKRGDDDSFEAMSSYAKAEGYTAPYLLDQDNKLANAFGATRTPEVFLFDGDGKLVYKGAMEDNPSDPASSTKMYLKSAIDNMVSGRTIDPNSTKSIGCSIKRG